MPKKKGTKKKATRAASKTAKTWNKVQQLGGRWATLAVVIPALVSMYYDIRERETELEMAQQEIAVQKTALENQTSEINENTATLEEEAQRATSSVQGNVVVMRDWLSGELERLQAQTEVLEERIVELEKTQGITHTPENTPIYQAFIPEPIVTRVQMAMGVDDTETGEASSSKSKKNRFPVSEPPPMDFYAQRDVFPEAKSKGEAFPEKEALQEMKTRADKKSAWEYNTLPD